MISAIFSPRGAVIEADERAFFRSAEPAGYILFARNCVDPEQLRALTGELRALHGRDRLLILVDQEGGRVARLKPPHWPEFPPASAFAKLYETAPMTAIEAARHNGAAMGAVLAEAGITVNCAPVLDLARDGAHAIVGDRSYGADPLQVAALGRAVLDGLAQSGVLGCIKHMPGHGRARADSHRELPVVEATPEELEEDFAPFRSLAGRAAIGMVAHIVYAALDADRAASVSPTLIAGTIRGDIGFGGLLLSDDIAMDALSGPGADRARAVVAAGCDLALHCSGVLADMEAVAAELGEVSDAAGERLAAAVAAIPTATGACSYEALAAKRKALLA